MENKKLIIWLEIGICLACVVCFLLGWVYPVEGPIDYLYDDYASQPAHKRPSAQLKKRQIIIDINDLSEEDFEALQEVFLNKR